MLLWSAKRTNQTANRFLSLALCTIVLSVAWQLGIDSGLNVSFPHWSWLPVQFSLVLGPLIYFYVLKTTRPEYKFRWKDMPHFGPVLLQQGALLLEITERRNTGANTYNTLIFQQVSQGSWRQESFRRLDSEYSVFIFERIYHTYCIGICAWRPCRTVLDERLAPNLCLPYFAGRMGFPGSYYNFAINRLGNGWLQGDQSRTGKPGEEPSERIV